MKHTLAIVLFCCSIGASADAQDAPLLRLQPGGTITGVRHAGTACFRAAALESTGIAVEAVPGGARLIVERDTLTLEATSPFLRTRAGLRQLAHPVALVQGELCIPEQFFLQFLPRAYPGKIEYREGVVRFTGLAAATLAPKPAKPAKRIVVLDPGHGGRDPGRIGPNGLAEKTVVLQIANRAAAVLRERGFEVHLTRTRDTLIALADRPRLANRWKGDQPMALFVSIHANAAPGRAQGFETFFLSDARTEDERRVAEMENASIEYEDQAEVPHGSDFEQLLNTLRNDFYVRASNDLADVVQRSLAEFHPGPNRGVKRAGFRVLVGAIMPAVLVEVAFIDDPAEARRLATAAFQQQLARGIAGAVETFFQRNEHLWAEAGGR